MGEISESVVLHAGEIQLISPIFTASYLKKYLCYTDETYRDYRGVGCLCALRISDLSSVVFFVNIQDVKVGAPSARYNGFRLFPIFTA